MERVFRKLALWGSGVAVAAIGLAVCSDGAHAALNCATTATLVCYNSPLAVPSAVPVNYATQAINSGTIVTLPGASGYNLVTTPATTPGPFSATITLSLPAGVTFASTPTFSCNVAGAGNACTPPTALSGAVGSNTLSITFPYTVAAVAGYVQLDLSSFTVTGLGALSTPVLSPLVLTFSSTDTNFPTATAAFATSSSAISVTAASATGTKAAVKIDVGSTALGKQFIQASADSTQGDFGSLKFNVATTARDATGTTPFSFGSFPATVTISGNFTNIASAYIAPATAPATDSCSTTMPPGATGATVTSSSLTFPNVPLTGSALGAAQEVCITANGTGVIGQNVTGLAPVITAATVNPTTLSATAGGVIGSLAADPYNGTVVPLLYTGNITGYPMFVRVVNSGGSTASVNAVVQPETGAAGVGAVATNLAASTNILVPLSTIITNSGVTLDATGRASIFLLSSSPTVGMEQLLVNPGGTVVNLN